MPRPTKAFHRMRLNAAAAWKRGDKAEAYKLWTKAADGQKEHHAKKNNKKKQKEAAAEAAGESTTS